MAKLSRGHQGSSSGTGPLFPPLHVNDAGKASLKAPPRNKMALFEQFTVPYNCYLLPNKDVVTESAFKQHSTNDFPNTYTQHSLAATMTPVAAFNNGVSGIGKSSCGSSLGSLSTCSAVVNADESRRFQVQEPEDDTCSLSEHKLEMVSGKDQSPNEKVLKDNTQDINVAKGMCLSLLVDCNGQQKACEQAIAAVSEGFQKWNKGFNIGGNPETDNLCIKEHSCQEVINNKKGLTSAAGSQLFNFTTNDCRLMENNISPNPALSKASNQLKSNDQCTVESAANALEKPVFISQGDDEHVVESAVNALEKPVVSSQGYVQSIATMPPITLCDNGKSSPVPPLQVIIKPKHVICTVGQQFFWKARKAMLRQQEVFSNQVFELHKLIEVQKLLSKMPSTLIEQHLLSEMALERVGDDLYPLKVNSKKKEISNKGSQEAQTPRRSEGQAHESKPPQKLLPLQEREDQVVRAESQTRRHSHSSQLPQPMMNTPHGQAPPSSSSDGISAWGYPIGSLNRPLLYPSGAGCFPSGSGVGGPCVIGSNPLMAPFSFPCYASRPEQQASLFCHSNPWPTPMYHNPVFTPMANDWFAMNYPGQFPFASGGEKPGPTNSVPSINMKAEASSHSVQPPVIPISQRRQVGTNSCTRLVATKSFGSIASTGLSTPPDSLSGKAAGPGYIGEHNQAPSPGGGSRFMPKVWGVFGGDSRPMIKSRGSLKDTNEGDQVPLHGREERIDISRSCGKNALNLFPLQPSTNSSAGASEGPVLRRDESSHGRIIKAIPRSALAASESAAGILRSIQRERQL